MSRPAKLLKLPAVTAYLVAGIIIGPFCLGRLGIEGLGFPSIEAVNALKIISDVALGFIAFSIGNEFRLSQLKHTGRQATIIGILQAVITTLVVDGVLIAFSLATGWISVPVAIVLGAIASATAPAATLMVVKQYKAKGPLTDLLLPVVALDDAVGLVIFAVSFGVAKAVAGGGAINVISVVVNPLIEIVASLVLGAVMGWIFTFTEKFYRSNSKRLSISITYVLLTVAISMLKFEFGDVHIGFSPLLVCMMLGTIFCNLCDFSEELMERADKWTAPLFILFFVLSGAELDFAVFGSVSVIIAGVLYILARSAGKYFGAFGSSMIAGSSPTIKKYLGVTLLPQAGVALGMSLQAEGALGADGVLIRNIVLFGVLIYELIGPMLTKIALTKAGDIVPDGASSARVHNDQRNKDRHGQEKVK
ncbi:MAG: sodium:proton antiporter [Ruminococcaceae bacterium]|nr:sodium:proton antiporter [Oscillospiraceae bacterium]